MDRLSLSFPVRRFADTADRVQLGPDGQLKGASWQLRHGTQVPDRSPRRQHERGPSGTLFAGQYDETVTSGTRTAEVGLFVSVVEVEGRVFGKVEANPARFADPTGCALLPARRLGEAVEVMWAAACEVTEPECSASWARVKRLDVARDFRGVTSPSLYVEGLGPVKRAYARRSFTYNDPARANAQTLYVGSGAGGVRLYDQFAAYGAEKGAPEGSLRFEVEARAGWLEKVGVKYADALDSVVVDRLLGERWEWSKMGQPVTGPVNAVEVLQRAVRSGEIGQAVADRLLGAMVRRSFGHGPRARTSEWRYREVTDRLGLTAEALWSDELSRQAVGRLDFETGEELLALTA